MPPLRPAEAVPAPAPVAGRGKAEPFGPPMPPVAPPPPKVAAAKPADLAACDSLLAGGTIVATRERPVVGARGCGIDVPVRLSAIRLADGGQITVAPPATIRCDFAGRVADWVRDDLTPLLANGKSRFVGLASADSYDCRGRNRVAGAKLSEHGTGNAIDIRALTFADGTTADITKVASSLATFAQIKLTACTRFSTVLGPGSDGFHEDNLHLDAAVRRNGAHFCRWRLP